MRARTAMIAAATALLTVSVPTASATVGGDLGQLRALTAKYHDINVARDEGYVQASGCVPGMGYHFVNFAYSSAVDPQHPTALLYLPSGNRWRLVAVEWVVFDADQDFEADEFYSIYGQTFHGPMSHGIPVHRELHVWTWLGNPDGVFSQTNPKVVCP